MKIVVKDAFVSEESRMVADKNGVFRVDRKQVNVKAFFNDEERKFPIDLQDRQPPYSPGIYSFDAESILTLSKYAKFEIMPFYKLVLVPVSPVVPGIPAKS